MAISEALLPEFDMEMANTRKHLERLPEDKLTFKPHEKSMDMGHLAGHIVEMPGWAAATMAMEEMDIAPVGGAAYEPFVAKSRQQVLEAFDKGVAECRAALAKATDQEMMTPWTLLAGGNVIFKMPRVAVVRSMIMNYTIHHRAQLGVYYRMNNVPVPQAYGPTADEK